MLDWTAIIVGVLSLVGTAIGAYSGSKLTAYRMEQLEKKVDMHNNFAQRIPVIEEQVKTVCRRVDEWERRQTE